MAVEKYGNGVSEGVLGGWTVVDKTTSDSAWAIPAGVSLLNVLIIGGGGGGGTGAADEASTTTTEGQGGGGGAGGAAVYIKNLDVSYLRRHNKTIPIVIGAGGAGATWIDGSSTSRSGLAGSAGTASSFGVFTSAGGAGGLGGAQANATQIVAAAGGDTTPSGSKLLLGSPTTMSQFGDFLMTSSMSSALTTADWIKFTGGSGAVPASVNITTVNTYGVAVSAGYPTSTEVLPTVATYSFSSIFTASGATGQGTYSAQTSSLGAGSSAGFCGGGGAGAGAYQDKNDSPAHEFYPISQPVAGVWGGGGGGGGIVSSGAGFAGGNAAANSGAGGGGGGGANQTTRNTAVIPTNNGGNGGSGRVIIFYRV
jgi:hypothetical protein